jgi:hypothetical protein
VLKWQKKIGTATPDSNFPLIFSSSMHVCERTVIWPLGQSDCSNGQKKMGLPLLIQFGSHEKLKAQLGLGHLQENFVASLIFYACVFYLFFGRSRTVESVRELIMSRLHPSILRIVEITKIAIMGRYIVPIDCCHERNFFAQRRLELVRTLVIHYSIEFERGTHIPNFF